MLQTILGSGGAIGYELAKSLKGYNTEIRLVSRNPVQVNESDQLFKADLTKAEEVNAAVKGSAIVYLTAGFNYSVKTWKENWPLVMRNVLDACKRYNAKLVFFDNIYMYDENHLNHMTEETPNNPPSKKGMIRKQIADMLFQEINEGSIKALIARSADFYGPSIETNSVLTETVFKPLSQGKKANWFDSLKYKHSYTYTPDAGKATALLGNTDEAYGQVWHLPTASDPFTGREWIDAIAKAMGKQAKVQIAPKWLLRILGLFNPLMKELVEMFYQYDRDYVFLSTKFESKFNQKATPYLEGINEIIAKDYSAN
jgi:nucleoside-diphosphate-sugar epimerase